MPEVLAALRAGGAASLVREVGPGVFSMPLLTADFCLKLRRELHFIEHLAASEKRSLCRPNSMNHDGLVLHEVGLEGLIDDLLEQVAVPLGKALFPQVGGDSLDHHHGFTVEYSPDRDRDLALHIDDAEMTINVCLGDSFEGGALRVLGPRCLAHADSPVEPNEAGEVDHLVGHALLHAGALRHLALPVTQGHRINLILWCRSSRFRKAQGIPARCGPFCRLHAA